jgi:diaminopimelate epimerase
MGPVTVIGPDERWVSGTVSRASIVDTGNPHVVLLDADVDHADIARIGPEIQRAFPGGVNVEWVRPGPGTDELTLRVWERGVGETSACGTGSCAAAAAVHAWGEAGTTVVVHNPGGDVTVELGETAVLTGPVVRIATLEFPWP